MHKLQRPDGPRVVQIVLQSVFVSKPVQAVTRGGLLTGKHNQDRVLVAVSAPSPVEDTVAVLPRYLQATSRISVEPRGRVHLPGSLSDHPLRGIKRAVALSEVDQSKLEHTIDEGNEIADGRTS
jgi:hypothetical protein